MVPHPDNAGTMPGRQEKNTLDARENQGTPSATGMPRITLPKGGGAIAAIDEKFSVNAVNGTFSLSYPLPFATTGGGAGLSLGYNSGAGNGIFGMGWSAALPSIRRKTEKQLPLYADADDSDTYIFSGSEDLVPVLKKMGNTWQKDGRETAEHSIRYYRPRTEGLFGRIERWSSKSDGTIHWRVLSKDNTTSIFGMDASARLADPADALRIFEWFVQFSFDDRHHFIKYEYVTENYDNVPAGELHLRNRVNAISPFTNTYLKRIRYGNKTPYKNAGDPFPADTDFLFETVLDYGEHAAAAPCEPAPGVKWSYRSDAFSAFRSGFDIRTCRLCRRVLLYHRNFKPGDLPGGEALVRSMNFEYDSNGQAGFTFLRSITLTGYTRHDDGHYTEKSMPPVTFSYQPHVWDTSVKSVAPGQLAQAPAGVDGSSYQWIDYYSEGLSGIFSEQAGGFFYKSNLGNGEFSAGVLIAKKPAPAGPGTAFRLRELESNGEKQLVQTGTSPEGFFPLGPDGEWRSFVAFGQSPNIDWNNPNLAQVDLNGDGIADLLIAEDEVLTWYASMGKKGYAGAVAVRKPLNEEKGPALVFHDGVQRIFFADMSGDGLVDIVRVRNGEVCYWPNLGYGKFGARIAMDNAPVFDTPEQFSTASVRLADIDGSGTTDIIYLGSHRFSAWLNLQGNRFAATPVAIDPFPELDRLSLVSVTDLLGTGTTCITWNSTLEKHAAAPLRYIDLVAGKKPHLLTRISNGLGKEQVIDYVPSTKYYLEDKKNGKPWITKLPFPVQCIAKVTTYDRIRKTRFASLYRYRHGYYDTTEREFRGFGYVEQQDTEDIVHFVKESGGMSNNVVGSDLHQPPVRTCSWFHTGCFVAAERMLDQYAGEYFPNPAHTEKPLDSLQLDDELMTAEELREAFRAARGTLLRIEIYALDGSVYEDKPYAVEQHSLLVKRLQEKAINRHAVFLAYAGESVTYQYERTLADPRISHSFVLKVDDFGNVQQQVAIGYGRVTDGAGLTPGQRAVQKRSTVLCTENDFTLVQQSDTEYRFSIGWQSRIYEIALLPPPASGTYYSFTEMLEACKDLPGKTIAYHETPVAPGPRRRLVEWTRTKYRANDGTTALAFGTAATKALVHETYKAAFTPELLQDIFLPVIPYATLEAMLTSTSLDGGGAYVAADGYFWIASGQQEYDTAFFFLPVEFRDVFNQSSFVTYDSDYHLFVRSAEDALGNKTQVLDYNFRVLSPLRMEDINGNRSAVRFDEFGSVTKTFVAGKDTDNGDVFDALKKEESLSDRPSSEIVYHRFEWYDQSTAPGFDVLLPYKPKPCYVHVKTWEVHDRENPARSTEVIESYAWSDGQGQVMLQKMQAEGGEALQVDAGGNVSTVVVPKRWIGNGRTIVNNKGKPVKQYEPYFSAAPVFDDEKEMAQLGVTAILHYDAAGRVIRTDFPAGTFSEVYYLAWLQTMHDENDTVRRSRWYSDRGAPDPELPLAGGATPGEKAAWLAAAHAETANIVHFDALGRGFLTVSDNKTHTVVNQNVFDSEGNIRSVIDALGREAVTYDYSMPGDKLQQHSMDAGRLRALADATGKPLISWNDRGHSFRFAYDAVHRILRAYVDKDGVTVTSERFEYGETAPAAASHNLRGKTWKHYDSAGLLTNIDHDFKNNLLLSTRQLRSDYKTAADWTNIAAVTMEAEIFESGGAYDALNRPIKLFTPHTATIPANEVIPGYNLSGLLAGIKVKLRGDAAATDFVKSISYNAKGQRESILYGNQVKTKYTYDPLTWRMTALQTQRLTDNKILQELSYVHDPVGNITRISDNAQDTFFHLGVKIEPLNEFIYDPLYRLVSASGREHRGQCAVDHGGVSGNYRNHSFIPLTLAPGTNEAEAFRNYIETYLYDKAGNLQEQVHATTEAPASWTRTFEYGKSGADMNKNNRLWKSSVGAFSFTYGTSGDGGYDAHGNLLKMEHLSAMDWDHFDHLVHVRAGSQDAYYTYDASGERIRKVIEDDMGRKVNERLYLGAFEIYREYTPAAVLKTERESLHILDDQKRIAVVETLTVKNSVPLAAAETLQRYQFGNHLSSAALELDDNGLQISYEEYFPYGTTSFQAVDSTREVPAKRYRFTGKERDEESGLSYHTARYYAPWLCRWTKCDPEGIRTGMNLYLYGACNPVKFNDPGGRDVRLSVDQNTHTITYATTVHFYCTADQIRELTPLARSAEQFYNSPPVEAEDQTALRFRSLPSTPGTNTFTQGGTQWTVRFQVNYVFHDVATDPLPADLQSLYNDIHAGTGISAASYRTRLAAGTAAVPGFQAGDNIMMMHASGRNVGGVTYRFSEQDAARPISGSPISRTLATIANLPANMGESLVHETGHLLGFDERYSGGSGLASNQYGYRYDFMGPGGGRSIGSLTVVPTHIEEAALFAIGVANGNTLSNHVISGHMIDSTGTSGSISQFDPGTGAVNPAYNTRQTALRAEQMTSYQQPAPPPQIPLNQLFPTPGQLQQWLYPPPAGPRAPQLPPNFWTLPPPRQQVPTVNPWTIRF